MQQTIDDQLLIDIEQHAVEIARQGGVILGKYFGQKIKVEYKDKRESDPVSQADRETQDYLYKAIEARFPDHGILGEEDDKRNKRTLLRLLISSGFWTHWMAQRIFCTVCQYMPVLSACFTKALRSRERFSSRGLLKGEA